MLMCATGLRSDLAGHGLHLADVRRLRSVAESPRQTRHLLWVCIVRSAPVGEQQGLKLVRSVQRDGVDDDGWTGDERVDVVIGQVEAQSLQLPGHFFEVVLNLRHHDTTHHELPAME